MFKSASTVSLILSALALHAQAPSPVPPPTPKPLAAVVAGIPVNYDESKVGAYTLPDPLKLANGQPVRGAATWTGKRRPEIVALFETQQYGRAPGRPAGLSFDAFDKGTPALNGKAIRKQVTIYLAKNTAGEPDKSAPAIHLVLYLPAATKKPSPMLLSISFGAVQNAVDDPGIQPQTVWDSKSNTRVMPPTSTSGRLNIEAFLDAGIGVATFYYGDVDPDYPAGFPNGIRARFQPAGQDSRAPDAWGSIAAWAWGMSRVEDYLETDPTIDSKRVAIHGVSRLGKTVMWAGAHDQRFAAVIASCSGEGGAALSHRNFGETIAHLTSAARYGYQFAPNYATYAGFPDTAPFDANLLVALIAPRPLLLQTGSTDAWSDPRGEFLAEVAAGPVYKLLGKQDLGTDIWPPAGQPIFHDLSYFMHEGGHGMVPSDSQIYVAFLNQHLHPDR